MKIEVVITVWEDGLFRLRDRIEADNFKELKESILNDINNAQDRYTEIEHKKHIIAEDDDIPF